MSDLVTLAALHARLILDAREAEALAARNPDHADAERCEAARLRDEARALAGLLGERGVFVPDPRQLALFSDGGPQA